MDEHLSKKDSHLYGQQLRKQRTNTKEISSSGTLAFTSQLSSLISSASSSSNKPVSGRARPKKEDIFSSHNKNVKKRALKDLEDSDYTVQKHKGRTEAEKHEDDTTWKRAKRKLEEKARLYDAMKRGDIEDLDDKYAVDFDRKWAEKQEAGGPDTDASSSAGSASEDEELLDYIDEFGRTRKMTRSQIMLEERRKRTLAADEPDRFTARPSAPENLIFGDTIQTAAFNPDETIAQKMAELVAKRDKSPTPPPDSHWDGSGIRGTGMGYFKFSSDHEERKKQMAELEKLRKGRG
ncbi:hypothetical protein GQ43DRAFT_436568 [Delitschia confertaspora ATCC 74209]|uniref:Uncharacterized protein n=1 Tax=Delitschia confertaspora ATCC 74209 TaxID=1513339 RepID=A0A9P4JUU5_9PLEO|nr:hypothetical protein GQ43DRAFT_436568 [Delitschia confertaspora ATCC 74209]